MCIYINPKPYPPYTPFWGVLWSALRGEYIFERKKKRPPNSVSF